MSGSRLALGALGVALIVAFLYAASRPEEGPHRSPGSSSGDDGAQGLTILATLLEESGREVGEASRSPGSDSLDQGTTAFLLDAGELSASDGRALASFVEEGGRLVIGGDVSPGALEGATGISTRPGPSSGEPVAVPIVPVAETAGVTTIEADGQRFSDVGTALPIAGDSSGDLAAVATVGEGEVVLLADGSPLQNGAIASADNALFAVGLAGEAGRPVTFVEDLAGRTTDAGGFAALPTRWAYAALLLLLAAITFLWARFRRLGEPDRETRELPPPRSRYVEGLADALARTNSAAIAGEPVRLEARRRLLASAGLGDDADADMLAATAARQGLDPEQAAALAAPLSDDLGAIRAGSALAKLWR